MLLVVDIGNTNITLGVFNNENIVKTDRLISDKNYSDADYELFLRKTFLDYEIDKCLIGSVVDEITYAFKKACDNVFGINSELISNNLKVEFSKTICASNEIGDDRIANACAAIKTYKLPAIIVDLGTATTFDIVSCDKKFIGGIIMPGLKMQLNALSNSTSKLPNFEVENSLKTIGDDTKSCIMSGVIRGSVCAISGLIKQCETELGEKATVIATGGYCEFISKYMVNKFDYVEKNLTLLGLKYIYESQLVGK